VNKRGQVRHKPYSGNGQEFNTGLYNTTGTYEFRWDGERLMSDLQEKYTALAEKITKKEIQLGLDALSNEERQFYLVEELLAELNNGGFDQYFTNSSGQNWSETLSVLEKLGFKSLAKLGKKAHAIYESDQDEDDKLDQLDELDSKFYEIDETEIYKKLLSLFS
jgi:hypothetical protein